jgi:hypothetical protein
MSKITRRNLLQTLGIAEATARHRGGPQHTNNTRIYHGPMFIPVDVAEALREQPEVFRTRGKSRAPGKAGGRRGRRLVMRYKDGDAAMWIFRCLIPPSRAMLGEVVLTPEGVRRFHFWAAVDPSAHLQDARYFEPTAPRAAGLIETHVGHEIGDRESAYLYFESAFDPDEGRI